MSPHRPAIGDRAGQQQGAFPEFAHLRHQGERAHRSGMAACAGADQDDAVHTRLDRLFGVTNGGGVVEHDAAIAMHFGHDVGGIADRGDDDRRSVPHAQRHVFIQPRVGLVHDLVHGIGRRQLVGIGFVVRGAFAFDARQPFIELRHRPRIERGEGAHHTRLALRDHQFRRGDDEHRRADHRQSQAVLQHVGQGHRDLQAGRDWQPSCPPLRRRRSRAPLKAEIRLAIPSKPRICGPRVITVTGGILERLPRTGRC
jgi:hypothetical protein